MKKGEKRNIKIAREVKYTRLLRVKSYTQSAHRTKQPLKFSHRMEGFFLLGYDF